MLIETLNKLQAAVINWTSPNAASMRCGGCLSGCTTTT
jgi:hypothetical protein